MTPGTPINFRPLWGLLAVLAGLCAVLFFACPLTAKHQANREIRIQHFARLEQPPMLPARSFQPQRSSKPAPAPTKPLVSPVPPQACAICGEPAQRYIHSIQSPFPENRQTYETPKVVNNFPPTVPYSASRPAAYANGYGDLHP